MRMAVYITLLVVSLAASQRPVIGIVTEPW
jgi:hypothetical protein